MMTIRAAWAKPVEPNVGEWHAGCRTVEGIETMHGKLILPLIFGMLTAGVASAQNLVVLSSASYSETVAPGSAVTAFGANLAAGSATGMLRRDGSLPSELNGVVVRVDGRGAEIAYVSPTQINFVLPRATRIGTVQVTVLVDGVVRATGTAEVARLAPAIFSTGGSGAGEGLVLNAATSERSPFPTQSAEWPGCDKRTRLTLLGSGVRFAGNPEMLPLATDPEAVAVTIEDAVGVVHQAEVEAVAASERYPGVDEVSFALPAALSVAEELKLRLVVEGVESNTVTIVVTPATVPALDCSEYGVAFAYNTVADLLAGDLWDVNSVSTVFTDLGTAPGDWIVSGVGTTALEARNGELIGTGVASSPELVWSDPEFPPAVRTLTAEPIAFVGLGVGNPASAVVTSAEPGVPIHQQVVDLAREHGLAFASIRVAGRFSPVSYSVAHNLLKQGTPLTDPTVDKAPFQLFFTTEESAEWELSGFYAAAGNTQEVVSVRGAPVHLHGFQLDRSRAGHIGSAAVENAEIRLYPLAPLTVREADLTLRNLTIANGRATFEAVNIGSGTVSRTTVQGRSSGSVVFQAELSDLNAGEPRVIAADLPTTAEVFELEIVIDPFNDVLEADEWNNIWVVR